MNPYLKNLNRIEFVVTLACSGRCKHCSEGEHTGTGEYFDQDKEYTSPYEEDPTDLRTISVSPDGAVLNGNVYEKGILELIKEYAPACR